MNKCIFYGRLTKDVELRYAGENNMAVARFSIAVDDGKTKETKKTHFFNCVAFGKTGENIEKFFHKGSRIAVCCRAQQYRYKDRDEKERDAVNFVVDEFDFVDTKAENQSMAASQPAQTQSEPRKTMSADEFMQIPDGIDDELPFS